MSENEDGINGADCPPSAALPPRDARGSIIANRKGKIRSEPSTTISEDIHIILYEDWHLSAVS